MGIVVIGPTLMDVKGHPFGTYVPAGRNAGHVIEVPGGVARNIAEDIARVGLAPSLVSMVDEGGQSDDIVSGLAQSGCDTRHIGRAKGGLGMWLAIFDESGDVVGSISQRPDTSGIERILIERGDDILAQADSVCVDFDIEEPIMRRILDLAERHGKEVFVPVSNMAIASEQRDLLRHVSCLVCNQQEAGVLFSAELGEASREDLQAALAERIEQVGLRRIVVTMGAQGSVFAQAGGASGWCPAQAVEVIDTTGAGDAFFAGVAVGLTYGKSLEAACGIGTRLAASTITREENVCGRFSPEELGL